MTEKNMKKLAEIVSDQVVYKLEKKQTEYDAEFHKDINQLLSKAEHEDKRYVSKYSDGFIERKPVETLQDLESKLTVLNDRVETYIYTQQYEKIAKVNKEIMEVEQMIRDFKSK